MNPQPINKPLVLVCEPIAQQPLRWLAEHARVRSPEKLSDDDLSEAEGLVVRTYTQVDEALLDRAPNLRVVARAGAGLDNIDLDACTRRGIRVVYAPGANSSAVVEYVISMMIQSLRPIARISEPLDERSWHKLRASSITPGSCIGETLGIIGLGRIGSRLARAADALAMSVLYHDLLEIDEPHRHGAKPAALGELLRTCRVISVHIDGRAENRHLLDDSFFGALRPDAIVINASRGFVLDEHAAAQFAIANPRSRLVLDVFDPEPLSPASPLIEAPNIVLTPHIAAGTASAKEAMSWVVRDVVAVLNGKTPKEPANTLEELNGPGTNPN